MHGQEGEIIFLITICACYVVFSIAMMFSIYYDLNGCISDQEEGLIFVLASVCFPGTIAVMLYLGAKFMLSKALRIVSGIVTHNRQEAIRIA